MRKILICLIALFAFAKSAGAQQIEMRFHHREVFYEDQTRIAQNYVRGYGYLGEKTGLFGTLYTEPRYFEGYLGVYRDIVGTFGVGVALGAERLTDRRQTYARLAASIYFGNPEKCYTEVNAEANRLREWWAELDLQCRVSDGVKVGLISQRFVGTGPQFILGVKHTPIELLLAPTFVAHQSQPNVLAGIQLVFQKKRPE